MNDLHNHDSRPIVGGDEHILLVEDEPFVLYSLQKRLEGLGYRVTVFGNSSDALEMVRATPQRYDLVITDHAMPKMTGLEMVKEMQKIRKDIPVILVTGVLDAKIEKQLDDLGIRICLEKPVFKHVLAASVRKALDGNFT